MEQISDSGIHGSLRKNEFRTMLTKLIFIELYQFKRGLKESKTRTHLSGNALSPVQVGIVQHRIYLFAPSFRKKLYKLRIVNDSTLYYFCPDAY